MKLRKVYPYSERDHERRVVEGPKGAQLAGATPEMRDDFDRDRARVLHSAALRRLADKTQVVTPQTGDTPRTRLTHSLEVAQISRGIAAGLGVDTDLAELAGLSHDIGHPPYGHNGERALDELAQDCGGFEGNAQTLRILSRLEAKVCDVRDGHPVSVGLNLTRASLDATCKYPWTASSPQGVERKKYSAYDEDAPLLEWIRRGAPEGRKCLEAQIMDVSDDIAYSVHDVEDAVLSGRVSLNVLWDLVEIAQLAEEGAGVFGGDPDALVDASDRLRQLPVIAEAADYDGTLGASVSLKAMTSQLVGRYISATVAATRRAMTNGDESAWTEEMAAGRFSNDLVVPPDIVAEITLLKSVAVLYVMDQSLHQKNQERQRDRLFRVKDYLYAGAPTSLDPLYQGWWNEASTDDERLRVVIDQLASMTESRLERLDRSARDWSAGWS